MKKNIGFNIYAIRYKCVSLISSLFLSLCAIGQLPNVIYILADDLGYGDVAIYNPKGKINTPNIDRLAQSGMRFTDAHTASSVCTPSRYAILTGRYPWRSRLPVGVLRGYSRALIEDDRPTVADLFKTYGYRTAIVGKWHLGLDWVPKPEHQDSINYVYNKDGLYGISSEMNPDHIDFLRPPVRGPLTQGFDYSFILPASLDMPPYVYLENDSLIEMPTGYTPGNELNSGYTGAFWRAGLMAPSFDFDKVLSVFSDKAVDYIANQSDNKNPFFLYFPMPAPHTPWMPTAEFAGRSEAGEYGDYVQEVDAVVGKVLKILEDSKLSNNTVIIFASDNGPFWRPDFVDKYGHKAVGELRGMKGDIYEGGHRVPFIVSYPGKIEAGTISDATISLTCLMATCEEMLGCTDKKFETEDSYSILPILSGEDSRVRDQPAVVHISSKGFMSIRKGHWKLIDRLGSGGFSVP